MKSHDDYPANDNYADLHAAAPAAFAEPWEARAFALAVELGARGRLGWAAFRSRLIQEIAEADRAGTVADAGHPRVPDCAARGYYQCWLRALERLALDQGLLSEAEIERRAEAIAAAPPARTRASGHGPIRIA